MSINTSKSLDKLEPGDTVYSITNYENRTTVKELIVTGNELDENNNVVKITTDGPSIILKKNNSIYKGLRSIDDMNGNRYFFTNYADKGRFSNIFADIQANEYSEQIKELEKKADEKYEKITEEVKKHLEYNAFFKDL